MKQVQSRIESRKLYREIVKPNWYGSLPVTKFLKERLMGSLEYGYKNRMTVIELINKNTKTKYEAGTK